MKDRDERLIRDSILKIGNVVSVQGRSVRVKVDRAKNVSHLFYNGETLKNISVGSYIKIRKGFEVIVGKIDGELVSEKPSERSKDYRDPQNTFERILEVKLFGFYDGEQFKKGTSEMPLIDNEAFLLDQREYEDIHNFVRQGDIALELGKLANDQGMPISVGLDSLFSSHVGIFGNTGSGKSYTLATLYWRLFEKFGSSNRFKQNARFLLLDFNGEYINQSVPSEADYTIVGPEYKDTYSLSTRVNGPKYPIEAETVQDETLWIIASEATEKTQAPFLRRAVRSSMLDAAVSTGQNIKLKIIEIVFEMTKSKNRELYPLVSNFLRDMEIALGSAVVGIVEVREELQRKLAFNGTTSEFYLIQPELYANKPEFEQRIKSAFANIQVDLEGLNPFAVMYSKIVLNFYIEISKGYSMREHIAPLIRRLEKRVDDLAKVFELATPENRSTKPMQVIGLKDVNIHIRKILPLIVCKHAYEKQKLAADPSKYLNIIIDEAHNILSDNSTRESEQWKDYRLETFEEIIKEGRKYGAFLTIASQRPYDISPTIVSQLHNHFLHRIVNEKDLMAIQSTVTYLDRVSFESLPILAVGTCILTGQLSQVPVVIDVSPIPERSKPVSDTYKPTDYWVA